MRVDFSEPIIDCRALNKSFQVRRREIPVLKGLDLSVSPGEIVVIKGRSGAGKSVLMWLLAGLDRPDTGDVLFKGQPFGRMSNGRLAALRAGHIGLIFQNFNLVTSWTALENIAAPLELKGLEPSEVRARSVALLSTLGLEDRLDNLPAELSVGQQQRVAVARTLITKPSLILADEPTGDVDPETATEIAHLLFAEVKERGATLIVATHGHFPCQGVNRVLSLKNGQLV